MRWLTVSSLRNKLEELFGADLRSLALLRMGVAVLVLVDLIRRARDLTAHYTDGGVLPRWALLEHHYNPWAVSVHFIAGSWQVQAVLFLVAAIFGAMLLVGYKTRLATIFTWYFLMSLQARNPFVINSGDNLLKLLLFWGIFLPWGEFYSLDRVTRNSFAVSPRRVFSVATFAYFMQVIFVYLFTVMMKTGVEWQSDASALYYSLHMDQWVTSFGHLLGQLPEEALKFFTVTVVRFEWIGPFLLFVPVFTTFFRLMTLAGFFLLQLGIGLSFKIDLFAFISVAAMFGFIPSWFWDNFIYRKKIKEDMAPSSGSSHSADQNHFFKDLAVFAREMVLIFLLIYVFLFNVAFLPNSKFLFPSKLVWIGNFLGLGQNWAMFCPSPPKETGWFVVPGRLKNGEWVDVYRKGAKLKWEKPVLASREFKNDRWKEYIHVISSPERQKFLFYYGGYLCHEWNSKHAGSEALEALYIYYVFSGTLPTNQSSPVGAMLLWSIACSDEGRST